jgi:hypothetical protein
VMYTDDAGAYYESRVSSGELFVEELTVDD